MDEMEERFQRLCREELCFLRGGVFRIVGNAADTDDVIQEALLRAYRRAGSFRMEADLRSWVYRIAVNCAFDLLRDRKRQAEAERRCADEAGEEKDEAHEAQLAALEHAVSELPELYRETVHIAVLSGLTGEEAAKQLGCSANTLYQRIHKAKELLREKMRRFEDG